SPCSLQRGWFRGERLGVGPGLGRWKVDAVDRACDGRAHVSRGGFGASHVGGASKAANALYKAGMATPQGSAARSTQGGHRGNSGCRTSRCRNEVPAAHVATEGRTSVNVPATLVPTHDPGDAVADSQDLHSEAGSP